MRTIAQIFVAFSEKLHCSCRKSTLILGDWYFAIKSLKLQRKNIKIVWNKKQIWTFLCLKTNSFQEEANTVLLEARLWDSNQTTKRNRLDISQGRLVCWSKRTLVISITGISDLIWLCMRPTRMLTTLTLLQKLLELADAQLNAMG